MKGKYAIPFFCFMVFSEARADCLAGKEIYRVERGSDIFDIPSIGSFSGKIASKNGKTADITLERTETGYSIVDIGRGKNVVIQKNIPPCPDGSETVPDRKKAEGFADKATRPKR